MKNISVFSLLLAAIFSQMIFASQEPAVPLSKVEMRTGLRGTDPQIQALLGRDLVVRVYNDCRSDPRAYQKFSVPLTEIPLEIKSFEDVFDGIKESAVIAVVDRDQTDETIAAAVAGAVYTESYAAKRSRNFAQIFLSPRREENEKLVLTDAIGNPIPSASVEIFLKEMSFSGPEIYLYKVTADEEGRLDKPYLFGSMRRFSFVVSQSDYGTAVTDSRFEEQNIIMPLVRKDSEAYGRSIHGVITDPQGNPVAGAAVQCPNVRTLGEGLISELGGGSRMSITGRDGAFIFYLPNRNRRNERGDLIPPKSRYHVRIEAPKELGLVPYTEPIENSGPVTIVLERGTFRKFLFEGENGILTDPDKLRYISLTINRPDKSRLNFMYDDFKDGGTFPTGEYTARMRGIDEFQFEPLLVSEYSPEELVFRLPRSVIYSGRVVHGFTGEPIAGAFVVGRHSGGMNNLSMITAAQWRALHELAFDAAMDEPAYEPLRQVFNFETIARTNEQGWFQMPVRPLEFVEFTAFDENFLGFKHRCHIIRADETGRVKLPVIKLFPAAIVQVELHTQQRIAVCPRWIIDEENNPAGVREFLAADDRRDNMFTYNRWLEQNKLVSFHIPAGVNVRVRLDAPYDEKWCPVEIPHLFNLAQGQVVDAGGFEFEPALAVSVEVIDSQGRAIEGVPVRKLRDDKIWSVAHNTDESGIARFFVVPDTEGMFGVSYHSSDGKSLRETIPYKINGEEDAGKKFVLRLSDEMLGYLFKPQIAE